MVTRSTVWSEYLAHPDYRIWGAARWNFQYDRSRQGYSWKPEIDHYLQHPLQQLKIYHSLYREKLNDFFDYLARLMPGGPLAFHVIPQLTGIDTSDLQPSNMNVPLIRGKDLANQNFFAMHLIYTQASNSTSIVLVFTQQGEDKNCQWVQEKNSCWDKNKLNLNAKIDLNYLLALIRGEDLNQIDFVQPKYIKTIKLAN